MTHYDLIKYFGSGSVAAERLGVCRSYVSRWRHERIPSLYQASASSFSKGVLKPDAEAKAWIKKHFPNGVKQVET